MALCGCQTYYYKITDNQTKKDFYKALNLPQTQLPVSVALTDPETGATTVTNSYTVTPITAEDYDAHRPRFKPTTGSQSMR
jgi:hypothetical protein